MLKTSVAANFVMTAALTMLLTFLVPSCFGQTQPEPATAARITLETFLREYLRVHGVENDHTTRYVTAFVDLNDDGAQEVIVYVTGQRLCGSGGCTTLVLAPTVTSYNLTARIPITRLPVRVLKKKSNGWHTISVWVQGGGIQPGYEAELPFGNGTYPSNPTVPPARRSTGKLAGQIVVPSTAIGDPLN